MDGRDDFQAPYWTKVLYLYNILSWTFTSMLKSRKDCIMNCHGLSTFNVYTLPFLFHPLPGSDTWFFFISNKCSLFPLLRHISPLRICLRDTDAYEQNDWSKIIYYRIVWNRKRWKQGECPSTRDWFGVPTVAQRVKDLVLLQLWHRLQLKLRLNSLAQELPYATGVAKKGKKKKSEDWLNIP